MPLPWNVSPRFLIGNRPAAAQASGVGPTHDQGYGCMLPEAGVLQTWSDAILSIALYLQSTTEHALTCDQ